jgi:excisionase family DNA binding protein
MQDTEPVSLDQATTGLSVTDAAELLGVSATTVRAHLRQGTLAGEKVSGAWVVYLAGLPAPPTPTSIPLESSRASADSAPASSRSVTILAWLLVFVRRLRWRFRELRTRVTRS